MDFKQLSIDCAELKFEDDSRVFTGYASMFGGLDAHGDTVEPGAYKGTLKGRDRPVRLRWNHFGPVIGKWLEIGEDDKGLKVKGELTPGHSVAENVYASMKHGAIDGMSIGYRVKDYEMRENVRHLKKIDLVEISVVEEPADLGAKIGDVKFLDELISDIGSLKEAESLLREAGGFSRMQAKHFLSAIRSLSPRDEGPKSSEILSALKDINITRNLK